MKSAAETLPTGTKGDSELARAQQTRIADLAHRRVYVEVSDIPLLPAVRKYLHQMREQKES